MGAISGPPCSTDRMKQVLIDRYGPPEEVARCAEVPPRMDVRQAAMLRINPPTALLLLSDFVELKPGDWLIQNVANSAVGRLVIGLARARGVKTLNVVRREALFAELKGLGADACVVDGDDLVERVKAQTAGAPIRLGLDAVSGRATARLSACVGEGGVVCNYGSMSGADPVMSRGALTSRGVTLGGFTRTRAPGPRSPEQVRAIYADLRHQILTGALPAAPVEKVYGIEEIKTALAHAQRGERGGKILGAPNGAI